jgi:hypothetical protein
MYITTVASGKLVSMVELMTDELIRNNMKSRAFYRILKENKILYIKI